MNQTREFHGNWLSLSKMSTQADFDISYIVNSKQHQQNLKQRLKIVLQKMRSIILKQNSKRVDGKKLQQQFFMDQEQGLMLQQFHNYHQITKQLEKILSFHQHQNLIPVNEIQDFNCFLKSQEQKGNFFISQLSSILLQRKKQSKLQQLVHSEALPNKPLKNKVPNTIGKYVVGLVHAQQTVGQNTQPVQSKHAIKPTFQPQISSSPMKNSDGSFQKFQPGHSLLSFLYSPSGSSSNKKTK